MTVAPVVEAHITGFPEGLVVRRFDPNVNGHDFGCSLEFPENTSTVDKEYTVEIKINNSLHMRKKVIVKCKPPKGYYEVGDVELLPKIIGPDGGPILITATLEP